MSLCNALQTFKSGFSAQILEYNRERKKKMCTDAENPQNAINCAHCEGTAFYL